MKQIIRSLALMAVILATLAVSSCSSDSADLLETVPAGSSYVAVVNVRAAADQLGVKIADGRLELPESWQQPLRRLTDDDLTRAATLADAIDLSQVVVFQSGDSREIFTARIADADRLKSLLDGFTEDSADGFKVYSIGSVYTLLTKGSQAWLTSSDDAVTAVSAALKLAAGKEEGSVASLSGVSQALAADKTARVAFNLSGMAEGYDSRWAAVELTLDKQSLAAQMRIMEADGRLVTLPGLQTLSTDFLRYTPPGVNFAAAIGATSSTDWSMVGSLAAMIPDPQLNGLLGTILPYLEKADGTVALAANVNTDDLAASGSTFLVMIHMPQAEVDAALAEITARMRSMGADPQVSREGVISAPGFYAGNIDGYLAVSSRPLTPTESNSLNRYFLSRRAALVIDLPVINVLESPFGATFDIQVGEQTADATLRTSTSFSQLIGRMLGLVI